METYLRFFKYVFIVAFLHLFLFTGNAQNSDTITVFSKDTLKTVGFIKPVTIVGTKPARGNNTYRFDIKDVKPLITVIGETDVLRYIGTLPGVSQGMEGGLGFFVRGSNNSNNRIELDNVPVYGSAHLFGLFSIFPADIVEDVHFRSGKIPASSGDLLASLTQISTITPQTDKYKGNFSISPFMTGGSLSGPILKDRLSFQVAGRFSLLGAELKLAKSIFEMEGEVYPEVADLYAGLHYRINNENSISASGYYSNDYFKYQYVNEYNDNKTEENWGNKIFRLSWDSRINTDWQMNVMAYYNSFLSGRRQQYHADDEQKNDLRLQTLLNEISAQATINYDKENIKTNFGFQGKSQKIQPASEKFYIGTNGDNNRFNFNDSFTSGIVSVFGDFGYTYKFLTPSVGYRGTFYGMGDYKTWDNNIRLALSVETSKETGLELSYDQFSQFHHIVEGLPVGWSLDMIIPADRMSAPEKAQQYYAGGFWTNKKYLFSFGGYYKQMNNLVSYVNAINLFGVQYSNWTNEIAVGTGESYGMEFHAEKKGEDWNVALSYTLSKTNRLFDEINDGKKFPFKFDRRHIFNFTGQVLTRKRKSGEQHFNISAAFSSGHNMTLPIGMYKGIEPPAWNRMSGVYVPPSERDNIYSRQLMSDINDYTLPYYFRIDAGYSFLHTGKYFTSEFVVGLFNILNRQNPYLVFYDEGQWKQLSIFPIIPSIKYALSF
ncbi:TonB-dependent receptor [Bacteroidia bacterium]|nr:TonB-dependent receptor [Bacteroidia bacterium]